MLKKRLIALAAALMVGSAVSLPVSAASITIDGAISGETYTAYKIFDASIGNDSYAYTITENSEWFDLIENYKADLNGDSTVETVFTLTETTKEGVYSVVADENFGQDEAPAFAAYLMDNIPQDLTENTDYWVETAANNTAVFDDLSTGYYLLDTSVGAFCSLFTAEDNAKVEEKNSIPTIKKVIVEETGDVDETTASIGDVVNFKITVTDGKGIDGDIVIHDVMESGLTLDKGSIKIDNEVPAEGSVNYNVADGDGTCTFEITLDGADYNENEEIIITYSATLNKDAEISTDTNDNTAWLTYSAQESAHDTVMVETFKFDVVKTDGDGALLGNESIGNAEFRLYNAETGGNEIKLFYDEESGIYRPVVSEEETAAETLVATGGKLTIQGLANGTYYLEEVKAPAGYNLLTSRVEVVISDQNVLWTDSDDDDVWDSGEGGIQVINEAGQLLPSTGGMGTVAFYAVGGVLAVGAAVILVTRKRVQNKER